MKFLLKCLFLKSSDMHIDEVQTVWPGGVGVGVAVDGSALWDQYSLVRRERWSLV